VIVIHQLPEIDETLWLRLLGKGGTQQRAISEVLSLPTSDPRREMALRLLVSWKVTIESTGEVDPEERELAMALSQAYLEWEKKTEERGKRDGLQQVAINMLRKGKSVEEVAELTELPVNQLLELQKQLGN
jgi:predicted HTH domain antitoxin